MPSQAVGAIQRGPATAALGAELDRLQQVRAVLKGELRTNGKFTLDQAKLWDKTGKQIGEASNEVRKIVIEGAPRSLLKGSIGQRLQAAQQQVVQLTEQNQQLRKQRDRLQRWIVALCVVVVTLAGAILLVSGGYSLGGW